MQKIIKVSVSGNARFRKLCHKIHCFCVFLIAAGAAGRPSSCPECRCVPLSGRFSCIAKKS